MSPTSVYSTRSSDPSSAAATGPVDSPMPRPNGVRPSDAHRSFTAAWRSCIAIAAAEPAIGVVVVRDGRAEARHHRVADELHDRAAVVEDRVVHLGAVHVQLPGELARVGALGDRASSRGCPTSAR